jgi:hypothetical protein
MDILNKKEETFDLVLTEKGREKLSKGKFIPYAYSFYDNEVIYDNSYNGLTEEQNDIQPRIKSTLILGEKVTSDDTIQEKTSNKKKDAQKYPHYFDLGGYEFIKPYKPAWKIYVKQGEITGSVKQFPIELEKTGKVTSIQDYKHDKIPQLNVFCEYKVYQVNEGDKKKTYIARSSEDISIEVVEENSFNDKENFIAEVFQFKTNYLDSKKLSFVDKKDPITQDNVEHFFNIFVDDEKEVMINYTDELGKLEQALPKDPKDC